MLLHIVAISPIFDSAFIDTSDGLAGLLIVQSAPELVVYDVIVEFYYLVPAGVANIGRYPAVMVSLRCVG